MNKITKLFGHNNRFLKPNTIYAVNDCYNIYANDDELKIIFEINFNIKRLSETSVANFQTDFFDKIRTIEFVDFSCGGGVFLTEIINYFEKFHLTK